MRFSRRRSIWKRQSSTARLHLIYSKVWPSFGYTEFLTDLSFCRNFDFSDVPQHVGVPKTTVPGKAVNLSNPTTDTVDDTVKSVLNFAVEAGLLHNRNNLPTAVPNVGVACTLAISNGSNDISIESKRGKSSLGSSRRPISHASRYFRLTINVVLFSLLCCKSHW